MLLPVFRQMTRLTLILSLLSLVLVACGGPATPAEPLTLTLHAQDIRFDVNTLSAKVGQPITLTYVNQGVIDHAFVIDHLVTEKTVTTGQTATFNFTASTTGTFQFYCAIPGHAAAGMTGELIVTQ